MTLIETIIDKIRAFFQAIKFGFQNWRDFKKTGIINPTWEPHEYQKTFSSLWRSIFFYFYDMR